MKICLINEINFTEGFAKLFDLTSGEEKEHFFPQRTLDHLNLVAEAAVYDPPIVEFNDQWEVV